MKPTSITYQAPLYRRVVAVVPAKNEAPTVGQVVRDILEIMRCTVVVVDDGSTDATAEVARAAGATVISLPFSLGAWCATQAGLRFAARHGYDAAVTLDADGQHHAEYLPILLQALFDRNIDVAIGACPQRLSRAKHLAWQYFRLLTQLTIKDFTSGLRAYNRAALDVLARKHASLLDYQDIGVLILLKRRGMRLEEVPVEMSPRLAGHSRVFSSWFAVGKYMAQTTLLCIARVGGNGRRPNLPTES